MRALDYLLLITIMTLTLFSSISYAGWPTFSVLTPQKIMSDLISTDGCPAGEGFIPAGTEVKIQNYYIPHDETWYWIYTGDTQCQKLPNDLQYIAFHQTGHYSGDLINTFYGIDNNSLFRFTFTIPEPYWYCGYFAGPNPPETVACAADQ